jgi:serine/threonine-protein kinase
MVLTPDKRDVQPLIKTPFIEQNGMISPDGRWLAYESNDTGQFEIYVRPFPDVNAGRWQVSTAGGIQPLWARNSQELFYLSPATDLMSVTVQRGASWAAAAPVKLFGGRFYAGSAWPANAAAHTFDVSPDGKRFVMIKPEGGAEPNAAPPSLNVVQNWLDEVRRLAGGR